MTTLQQALIDAKLVKDQISKTSVEKFANSHDENTPTLGINAHGNMQYYIHGKCVCPNCLERYTNVSIGDECDLCQIQEVNQAVF